MSTVELGPTALASTAIDVEADAVGPARPGGGGGGAFAAIEFVAAGVGVETGARADGFRFGETCAELVVADMLESVLFPRIIAAGFSFFSFFSFTGGGCTGEGVGRGKAMLLLSGRAVITDVGGLIGRDVPMGAADRATGRAIGIPLPQAAELGSDDPAIVSSIEDGLGHDAFCDIGGAVT